MTTSRGAPGEELRPGHRARGAAGDGRRPSSAIMPQHQSRQSSRAAPPVRRHRASAAVRCPGSVRGRSPRASWSPAAGCLIHRPLPTRGPTTRATPSDRLQGVERHIDFDAGFGLFLSGHGVQHPIHQDGGRPILVEPLQRAFLSGEHVRPISEVSRNSRCMATRPFSCMGVSFAVVVVVGVTLPRRRGAPDAARGHRLADEHAAAPDAGFLAEHVQIPRSQRGHEHRAVGGQGQQSRAWIGVGQMILSSGMRYRRARHGSQAAG